MKLLGALAVVIRHSRPPERLRRIAVVMGVLLSLSETLQATPRAEAAFPGRNGLIVFDVRQPDPARDAMRPYLDLDDYDLFVVRPGGAGLSRLTTGPEADTYPDWSPDGRMIAFTRATHPGSDDDVYVMRADGTEVVNLTPNTPASQDRLPTWSPDGTQIAFSSSRGDLGTHPVPENRNDGLYVMNADGTEVRQLADAFAIMPEWSPDGAWIAVATYKVHGIDLISLTGTRRHILRMPGQNVGWPDWSPDGKRLVFSTGGPRSGEASAPGELYVMNADGSGLTNLTRTRRVREVAPNWSPDGRYIVFVSDRDGANLFYRMDADGSNVISLIDIQLDQEVRPDWGPRP